MRFDMDMNSSYSDLFSKVRSLIMEVVGESVKEKFTENLTSYHCEFGGVCYLRTYPDRVHIGWFRGVQIDDKFGFLTGNGKTIRGHRLTRLDEKNVEAIKYYINETISFLIEYSELKKATRKI
ncbi:MAG: hypothetical protein OIF32_00065 [Campylobacterales bacterium]|nr:hypothetical protein [Campylobacterales bacterium]